MIEKLRSFDQEFCNIAKQGQSINVESKIIEYGQYLRYEVERFIKNKLLFWDADRQFSKALSGIKKIRNHITDEDLDKINEIYRFCNWTTSHVDVGDNHGLEQLKTKINEFINICS